MRVVPGAGEPAEGCAHAGPVPCALRLTIQGLRLFRADTWSSVNDCHLCRSKASSSPSILVSSSSKCRSWFSRFSTVSQPGERPERLDLSPGQPGAWLRLRVHGLQPSVPLSSSRCDFLFLYKDRCVSCSLQPPLLLSRCPPLHPAVPPPSFSIFSILCLISAIRLVFLSVSCLSGC